MDLIEKIYEEHLVKFGEQTREETYLRMCEEIKELQEARLKQFQCDSQENRLKVKFEEADVIITAIRLYKEYDDLSAWLILDLLYNYETAKYVQEKWEIVKKRKYVKDSRGLQQHVKENEHEVQIL